MINGMSTHAPHKVASESDCGYAYTSLRRNKSLGA